MRGEREGGGGKRIRNRAFEKEERAHRARERKNEEGKKEGTEREREGGKRERERESWWRIVMCRTENLCVSKQTYTRENKVNSQKFMTKSVFRKNCNWQA